MSIRSTFFAVFSLLVFSASAFAAPGDLDSSFGAGGKVVISMSSATDSIADIAVQTDGKIIAVGRIGFQPAVTSAFGIVRFHADGSLDTNFGSGGIVTTSFETPFAWATGVKIQPDHKIVVSGTLTLTGGKNYFAVARYLPDGSLDPDFSQDGKIVTMFGGFGGAQALTVQPDGKIVVAGNAYGEFAAVRYLSDGTPDRLFGNRGKAIMHVGSLSDVVNAVQIQADGKILIAGHSDVGASMINFAIMRLTPNGKADGSFGTQGIQKTGYGLFRQYAHSMALQSDGKPVLAGFASSGTGTGVWALARYTANGALDGSFDGDGRVTTGTGGLEGVAYDILIQPDGKLLVGGSVRDSSAPGFSDFLLMRYNPDGTLDNNFGTAGKKRISLAADNDEISSMALQADGRIVAAGFAISASGSPDFALARFLTE